MIVDLWHAVGGYFFDVFVQRLDWWAYIGIIAQALFTGRFVVQWLASEKAGRSVIPFSFWTLSIVGGLTRSLSLPTSHQPESTPTRYASAYQRMASGPSCSATGSMCG